jgi:hypothetical protein
MGGFIIWAVDGRQDEGVVIIYVVLSGAPKTARSRRVLRRLRVIYVFAFKTNEISRIKAV